MWDLEICTLGLDKSRSTGAVTALGPWFARQTVVHRSSLVKVRSDTDLALFPPLGYGLQTAAGAILNTLNMQAGKTVAIFGLVGMSVPYWIKPGT
ncbi:Pc16g00480 [Penicillium rubens Wisconsin 54-1255]|uniref:Pc16g00480 protein n=1 Tax=Penicillium rubens (strain ATCC 28089 / DSM 1075 / NRRL 1951 / Wisconsin 54-1255) TaxID=500485 RepID=B6H6U7_PENRW|nr:Pc16g00480 [Penicillium rubens Wisconsin 54-1255]